MSDVGFAGALGGVFDYKASKMFTSIPAVVVGIKSLADKRIDVQPSLMMRVKDGATGVTLPPILNVPLQMPCTSKGGLTYPIEVGDSVILMFSQRGIDTWKRGGGGMATPSNLRVFDAQDAIAIVGVHPFVNSPNQPSKRSNSHSVEDVVLVHNIGSGNEVEIRLKTNGDVEVNSPSNVIVNCKNALVNAEDNTRIRTGQDFGVDSDGNTAMRADGWSQTVSDDAVLVKGDGNVRIKSNQRLILEGSGGRIVL